MVEQVLFPKVGDVLESPFWPEPIRVLTCELYGHRVKVEAVGTRTRQFYNRFLSISDLKRVTVYTTGERDFCGNGKLFFLAIEAHRIRNAAQFDPLFAVNVSQIDPLPHQIEAVYGVILKNPRIRFLLADDPGAGKTIMAGLLLKELKYRGLVQRTLIVVPGHLKEQWLREMKERFGELFTLVDRNMINATWGRNIWQEQSQVITSMDFIKQEDVMATLAEVNWDLVIVDEAHKMAAYRYGEKTKKTERYKVGELLSRTSQFLLFLTATPHRGDPENFLFLLNLLEPDLFASVELLQEATRNRENPLFLRRLKEDLKDFENRPLFPRRHVKTIKYRLNDSEKRLYNAVTSYVEKWYNRALNKEKRNVAFALLVLQRRLASSVRAVRLSLERRRKRLQEFLEQGKWLFEDYSLDEDELEDASESVRLQVEEEFLERLTAAETCEELEEEISLLDNLIHLAQEAEQREIETKLKELLQVMQDERIRETQEKLLIFTEARETLEYLAEKLTNRGYRVVTLHGGMNLDARTQAEHEFRENAQVMISTEAGGEGINLQFCSLMVNYDIPWNPNRLEQRMGRIHRYGQRKEVHIYNLVASDTREGKVLEAIFRKLERIRDALGNDRVFDVIGDLLSGRNLKDLIVDAVTNRKTIDDILAEILPDEEAIRRAQEITLEALATRHIDLQCILKEDRYAREHRLVPEYIEQFFLQAGETCGLKIERNRDETFRVLHVPYEIRNTPASFRQRFGDVFREYHRITFDKNTARLREAVFVAPGHPLLEAVIESIFAKGEEDLHRGATFIDPDGRLNGWLWFFEGEVRDGKDQVAGRRLFAVFQSITGELQEVNPSILWDLKPDTPWHPPEKPPEERSVLDKVLVMLEGYRAELERTRERIAEIKRKYGLQSLEERLLKSEAKLIDYETRKAKGDNLPEVELQNERRRKEELAARLETLKREIECEVSLLPAEPKLLGVARVLPLEEHALPKEDPAIEAIGMQVAMEYEYAWGRKPQDVSRENLGYDIRSEGPDGTVRYIEVKARAQTGPVVFTPNEWLKAKRLQEEYWLYIVENAASTPRLFTIQNPAAKLNPQKVIEVVRYIADDWKKTVETEGEGALK
nr:helicase-related protein [Candidatus Calescibacterium sp.]